MILKKLIHHGLSEIGIKYGFKTAFPPHTIYIVINSVCNLHCKTCDVGQKNKDTQFYKNMIPGKDLELDVLKKLIDEVKVFKPTIAVTSTEPLLYKDLLEFSKYVKDAGLPLQITTNGYLLKDFAKEFVELEVDSIWVSIDGPNDTHNMIRGKHNSYERAINGINQLDIEKAEIYGLPARSQKPQININYTISNHNYGNILKFMEELRPIQYMLMNISFSHLNFVTTGVEETHNASFGHVYPTTTSCISGVTPEEVDPSVLFEQLNAIKHMYPSISIQVAPNIGYNDIVTFYNRPETFISSHSRCTVPWRVSQIFSDGSVGVSTRCYKLSFGNIHDQPFMSIWNGDKFKKFRSDLYNNGGSFPACSRCCGVF